MLPLIVKLAKDSGRYFRPPA